jgi:hypothetical protein
MAGCHHCTLDERAECRAVVGVAVRIVLGFLRHVARLAGMAGASVQGTFALGPREGKRARHASRFVEVSP